MASYELGSEVLTGWKIVRELGRGAYGRVFEVEKTDYGIKARAALKIVSVPPASSMFDAMRSEGMDDESIADVCADMVKDMMSEISLLASLGHPNVVHYQDHKMVPHTDDPGCDVIMRMEQLVSLTQRMKETSLCEAEVVQLGKEIADALAFCHERGIVHRDVKPQNVFIDASGHYKLGDFGVARMMDGGTMTLSRKGTPPYMAPELVLGGNVDARVDVYSLGIMLYQLLNNGRLPFYPAPPMTITYRDRQEAQKRRLKGERFPAINNCDQNLMSIIMQACAFDASKRPTAKELRDRLRAWEAVGLPTGWLNSEKDDHIPYRAPTNVDPLVDVGGLKDIPFTVGTLNIWDSFGRQESSDESSDSRQSDSNKTLGPASRARGTAIVTGTQLFGLSELSGWPELVAISAGGRHTVGLLDDGTVIAAGCNDDGECNVTDWTGVVAVSAGGNFSGAHTVGLLQNGSVVASGSNSLGQCDVSEWKSIVAISAGEAHTIGLRRNGTVIAAGSNLYGQCDVFDWTDIVAVSAGGHHTVGLRGNGTVVATGSNRDNQCSTVDWSHIVEVSAGASHTIGLRDDGTVVATGDRKYGRCDVDGWKDVRSIAAGGYHTVGLHEDGTVSSVGDIGYGQCDTSDWSGIKYISAGTAHTVGLCKAGSGALSKAHAPKAALPVIPVRLSSIGEAGVLASPMSGTAKAMTDAPDAFFASLALGDGAVIEPTD